MCLKSGMSFVLQDEEGEVWKCTLCYHTPMHTSPTHVQGHGRPQRPHSPLPIPLAFILQLQPGWTIAFLLPHNPCWSSTSGNNRVSGMSIKWCLMHGTLWSPWMWTWGASRTLEVWVTPPGSAFLFFWGTWCWSLPRSLCVCGGGCCPPNVLGKIRCSKESIPQNTAKGLGIKIPSEVHPTFIATLKS